MACLYPTTPRTWSTRWAEAGSICKGCVLRGDLCWVALMVPPQGRNVCSSHDCSFVGWFNCSALTTHSTHPTRLELTLRSASSSLQRGYMGTIGPFPADIMNDNYVLTFEGVAFAKGADQDRVSAVAARVCCGGSWALCSASQRVMARMCSFIG